MLVIRDRIGSVIQQVKLSTYEGFTKHLANILLDGDPKASCCQIYEGKEWRYGDYMHRPCLNVFKNIEDKGIFYV